MDFYLVVGDFHSFLVQCLMWLWDFSCCKKKAKCFRISEQKCETSLSGAASLHCIAVPSVCLSVAARHRHVACVYVTVSQQASAVYSLLWSHPGWIFTCDEETACCLQHLGRSFQSPAHWFWHDQNHTKYLSDFLTMLRNTLCYINYNVSWRCFYIFDILAYSMMQNWDEKKKSSQKSLRSC